MPSPGYSLPDTLERIYENQLALEAAMMDLTLLVESLGHDVAGDNVRGALHTIGENVGISSREWLGCPRCQRAGPPKADRAYAPVKRHPHPVRSGRSPRHQPEERLQARQAERDYLQETSPGRCKR